MADVYKQSFKQNYTNNIELSIFNCGIERCAPSKTWGPGIRDHYLIHLVLSGKGEFEVGGRTWQVSTGDLFFARPSQLIRYTADEQYPWEYSWVGFNGACAHKLAAQLPFTDDAPVHHTSDPDGMRAALANIYSSRGLQPQDEAAMVGYLYLFIAALMKETIAGKPHSTSSSSQYVLNAIKYIQFNYSHDISIDDVAKSVGVSRSHLYRVFMLNVGKSPIDYLTEYRINEACKLLRAGHLSIAEVAVSVGFFDQFYFSRVFKRAKGVPPSKYFAAQQDADPVKSSGIQSKKVSYKWRTVTKDDMKDFNDAWWQIVKANPQIALDALFAECFGYFNVTDLPYVSMDYYVNNDYVQSDNEWIHLYNHQWRNQVAGFAKKWGQIPVLGWVTHGNLYVTLTLLIGAAEVVLRRWRSLSWHLPLLLLMGVMITAPANNFERHMLPIAFVFGFLCLEFWRESRAARLAAREASYVGTSTAGKRRIGGHRIDRQQSDKQDADERYLDGRQLDGQEKES